MPIRIEEFEDFDSPTDHETNGERVLRFLLQHRDKAFKAAEIAEQTDVAAHSIHPVLSRLEDRGLVRHKQPYWAIGDSDAVRDALALHSTAEFLDQELGEESREAWLSATADEM